MLTKEIKSNPRILLVDDDPVFGMLMEQTAKKEHISLVYFNKPKEVYDRLQELVFDVALIDFDLGIVNGLQLSNFMNRLFEGLAKKNIPVILISSTSQIQTPEWPLNITKFITKAKGTTYLLDAALSVHKNQTIPQK